MFIDYARKHNGIRYRAKQNQTNKAYVSRLFIMTPFTFLQPIGQVSAIVVWWDLFSPTSISLSCSPLVECLLLSFILMWFISTYFPVLQPIGQAPASISNPRQTAAQMRMSGVAGYNTEKELANMDPAAGLKSMLSKVGIVVLFLPRVVTSQL